MIGYASHLLLSPKSTCSKLSFTVATSWKKPFNTLVGFLSIAAGPGKIPPTESGNGKRGF